MYLISSETGHILNLTIYTRFQQTGGEPHCPSVEQVNDRSPTAVIWNPVRHWYWIVLPGVVDVTVGVFVLVPTGATISQSGKLIKDS